MTGHNEGEKFSRTIWSFGLKARTGAGRGVAVMFGILLLAAFTPAVGQRPSREFYKGPPATDPRNLNGIWHAHTHTDITEGLLPGEEISFTAYGAQRYKNVDHAKAPANTCLPSGVQRAMHGQFPFEIVQGPTTTAIAFEYQRTFRLIYTDGRGHPKDIADYLEWFGSSVGKWEGDTLVVDTIGFDDRTWMDSEGLEHSDKLHTTERFQKTGPDTIKWTMTVEDPVFFTKPFTYQEELKRQDTRIMSSFCLENEKDAQHMLPTPGARHGNTKALKFPN